MKPCWTSYSLQSPQHHIRKHGFEMQPAFLQRVLEPGWITGASPGSDFTHYGQRFGFQPFPPDARVRERIEKLDMGLSARIAARDAEGLILRRQLLLRSASTGLIHLSSFRLYARQLLLHRPGRLLLVFCHLRGPGQSLDRFPVSPSPCRRAFRPD